MFFDAVVVVVCVIIYCLALGLGTVTATVVCRFTFSCHCEGASEGASECASEDLFFNVHLRAKIISWELEHEATEVGDVGEITRRLCSCRSDRHPGCTRAGVASSSSARIT